MNTAMPAAPNSATRRVLLVDDEVELLGLIRDELVAAGYEVDTAVNGQEALAAAARRAPDLVVSDVSMPVMDGFELLRRIRAEIPGLEGVPVIFLSALAGRDDVLAGRRLGADDYLTKPIDFDVLLAMVETRLAHSARLEKLAGQERERILDRFLALVPHELRTPLSVIIASSEVLGMTMDVAVPGDVVRRQAASINEAAWRLLSVLNDIIDLSAVRDGGSAVLGSDVDVGRVVLDALGLLRSKADAKTLSVIDTLEPDLWARGDERYLRLAIFHLVANAITFTPAGGRVMVTAGRSAGDVTIVVEDTGPGIDPAHLARLQEPFEQAEGIAFRRNGGLGLGLPLARTFVERQGGTFALRSAPGIGTRVTLTLPDRRRGAGRWPTPPDRYGGD